MKFLIVGGGSIGTRHINNLQNIGFKDIGCFKRCPDEDYAKKHDVIVITTESGVDEFNPDAIFICNPTSKHIEWTRIALKYDAAVFMEKPLTHSPEELNDFTSLWSGKVFFIGFMLRYHPLVSKIKELLDLGVIGDVFNARLEFGSYLPYWHPWEDYKISYASRKELGGGVVNTITHELDLAQFFFGMPKGVSAVTANFGRLGIGVEELAESLLIYDDKVVALHTDYLQKDYNRNIQILGDKGAIRWGWHDNVVKVEIHNGLVEEYNLKDFDVNKLYIDELKDFIDLSANNIIEHPLDANHAIANTKLMLAIHESASLKRQIFFDEQA